MVHPLSSYQLIVQITLEGLGLHTLILDEFAYIKEDVVNTVILPTLNPNGKKVFDVYLTPAR